MFLVFAGDFYYPQGGWDDLYKICETLDEAKAAGIEASRFNDWVHIINPLTNDSSYCFLAEGEWVGNVY